MTIEDDEELARRVEDLEESLRGLQSELKDEHRRGLRPPRPTELLRLADQHAIPIAIAFLEAHIHALKLLQGLIRATGASASASQQSEAFAERAVGRLDALISDLSSTPLPDHPEARDVLEQAESLRDDLAEKNEQAAAFTEDDPTDIGIDVDEELDAIKSDMGDNDGEDDQPTGEN